MPGANGVSSSQPRWATQPEPSQGMRQPPLPNAPRAVSLAPPSCAVPVASSSVASSSAATATTKIYVTDAQKLLVQEYDASHYHARAGQYFKEAELKDWLQRTLEERYLNGEAYVAAVWRWYYNTRKKFAHRNGDGAVYGVRGEKASQAQRARGVRRPSAAPQAGPAAQDEGEVAARLPELLSIVEPMPDEELRAAEGELQELDALVFNNPRMQCVREVITNFFSSICAWRGEGADSGEHSMDSCMRACVMQLSFSPPSHDPEHASPAGSPPAAASGPPAGRPPRPAGPGQWECRGPCAACPRGSSCQRRT